MGSESDKKTYRLGDLVARLGGELHGPSDAMVWQVAPIERAGPGQITFLSNPKFRSKVASSAAEAIIVGRALAGVTDRPHIVCDNPYAYFARVSQLLNPAARPESGIHPSAVVDPTAQIDPAATVGPLVTVGARARIGKDAWVGASCVLGSGVEVGEGTRLYPRVVIYDECRIGARCIIHSGAVIGADGFGFAHENGEWIKIPQIGRVLIGDDVEIGANTTIDRGAIDDTVIESGVKLDNLIQIAHNVYIGAHTAMAGCVGVAGSTKFGRHCTIGGAANILGHLELADHVNISAGTMITKSIPTAGTYTAVLPFSAHAEWLRNAAQLRHLDKLAKRLQALEKLVDDNERKTS